MSTCDLNSCPLNPEYLFDACCIRTCKNHTSVTKRRCIELDRVKPEGNKVITDSEIRFYKYPNVSITTRNVSKKRKEAVENVKNLIILYYFIQSLKSKAPLEARSIKRRKKLESKYPLNIEELEFKPYMWEYLNDENLSKFMEGKNEPVNIQTLLNISPKTYLKIKGTHNEYE